MFSVATYDFLLLMENLTFRSVHTYGYSLHDMGSWVFSLDVADLTVDALLCRRDTAIAIDVHESPFWLKDNERHF